MVNFNHIESAHNRISNFIHNTPILTCENINKETNTNLFFKCDNFQKTGSFKIRGATNTILQLSKQQLTNGVITTSSGNHGAAVALAATRLGANVKVIMPLVCSVGSRMYNVVSELHTELGCIVWNIKLKIKQSY